MANLKEVRIRIASVSSTQQITKAMKLVSATKLRKAQNAIVQMRPYSKKLNSILSSLSDSMDVDTMKIYFQQKEVKKVLVVVITSDRGLCGAFNANVVKLANKLIKEKYEDSAISVMAIGRKASDFFSKQKVTFIEDYKNLFQNLSAESAFGAGQYILDEFRSGKYDQVEVVYNQFKNAATQILTNEQFLPIVRQNVNETEGLKTDYIFEPSKAGILESLIPQILKTQLYRSMLDSFASEHGARMVAMDKATENAGDLIKSLKIEYNRARQAAITKEISEIVGGAAALS